MAGDIVPVAQGFQRCCIGSGDRSESRVPARKHSREWLKRPYARAQEYSAMLAGAGLEVAASQDLTDSVVKTWDIVCARVRNLRLFSRVAPPPVRDFCKNIDLIHEAFRERMLTYQIWVAVRG
jgi:hypothetical protein